ncbi:MULTISPECIES: hypothetical protein [Sutcliffiella]|uniref:Uncharacterized protein n=1 Tax=Sutcliffiella cohnii TaxID=33932 RepID=A0A223KQX4_9BACI|nr:MULTISPECIES: hypothetical protein [Sutcliffiella]AST91895.1 hypothetical protein BC6307_11705 [Sutcliffiella cohnii]WBL13124.1 hypothetical protein O1A01_14390 [Sutcliffiella sp. NC1]
MKRWLIVIPLLLIGALFLYINGYRLTPENAANSHSFLPKDAILIEQVPIESSTIFVYKSDKEKRYLTVLSEKTGFLYRSGTSTYTPFVSDTLQTVGVISFWNDREATTYLSVLSTNDEVAYIEVGIEPDVIRREIRADEMVSFYFPFSHQIDFIHPTAYDKDGNALYYYGYPKNSTTFSTDDFKWHRIDD